MTCSPKPAAVAHGRNSTVHFTSSHATVTVFVIMWYWHLTFSSPDQCMPRHQLCGAQGTWASQIFGPWGLMQCMAPFQYTTGILAVRLWITAVYKNSTQNASKCTIFHSAVKRNFLGGHNPFPDPFQWGGENPLLTPHPLSTFGTSAQYTTGILAVRL